MKVWIVSEGNCDCCMYVSGVYSAEEKANAYETDSKYVEIDWFIVDEED
ncbi:hypothetical protein SEA_PHREDRICK_240 [Streptomyces phage Phredrick]|nr:hypothetical protein SEA_PHREDRICK_240 [Streptomyces phage Phredrick]